MPPGVMRWTRTLGLICLPQVSVKSRRDLHQSGLSSLVGNENQLARRSAEPRSPLYVGSEERPIQSASSNAAEQQNASPRHSSRLVCMIHKPAPDPSSPARCHNLVWRPSFAALASTRFVCAMLSPSARPLLFRFALHRGRVRVLALDPVPRAPGTIWRVASLGHDALKPELAGMVEDKGAILLN